MGILDSLSPSEEERKRKLEERTQLKEYWEKRGRPAQYPFWLAQETLSNVVSNLLTLHIGDAFKNIKDWVTAGKPDYLYVYDDLLKQKPDLANIPLFQKLPYLSRDEFTKFKKTIINTRVKNLPEKEELDRSLDHLWVSAQFYKKTPFSLSKAEKEILGLILGSAIGGASSEVTSSLFSQIMKTKFGSSILGKALLKGTPEAIGWGGFSIGYDLPEVMDKDSQMTVSNMFENAGYNILLAKLGIPALSSAFKATAKSTGKVLSTAVWPVKWSGSKALEKAKKNPELIAKIEEHFPRILWGTFGKLFNEKAVIPKEPLMRVKSITEGMVGSVAQGTAEKTYNGLKVSTIADEVNRLFERYVISNLDNVEKLKHFDKLGLARAEDKVINVDRIKAILPEQKFTYLWNEGLFNPDNPIFNQLKEHYPNLFKHVEDIAKDIKVFEFDKDYLNLLKRFDVKIPKSLEKAQKTLNKYQKLLESKVKEKTTLEDKFGHYTKAFNKVIDRIQKQSERDNKAISRDYTNFYKDINKVRDKFTKDFEAHIKNIDEITKNLDPAIRDEILSVAKQYKEVVSKLPKEIKTTAEKIKPEIKPETKPIIIPKELNKYTEVAKKSDSFTTFTANLTPLELSNIVEHPKFNTARYKQIRKELENIEKWKPEEVEEKFFKLEKQLADEEEKILKEFYNQAKKEAPDITKTAIQQQAEIASKTSQQASELAEIYKQHIENLNSIIGRFETNPEYKKYIERLKKEKDLLEKAYGRLMNNFNNILTKIKEKATTNIKISTELDLFRSVYNKLPSMFNEGKYQEMIDLIKPFTKVKSPIGGYASATTKFFEKAMKDLIGKDKSLDTHLLKMFNKMQQLKETVIDREQKLLKGIDKSIFERFSIASDYMGALRRSDPLHKANSILSMKPEQLQVYFKKTLMQPLEFKEVFGFLDTVGKQNIPKFEVKRVVDMVTEGNTQITPEARRRIIKEIEFNHALPFKADEESLNQIIQQLGAEAVNEEVLFGLLEQIPSIKNISNRIQNIILQTSPEANELTARATARRIITNLYGLAEKVPADQRFLVTPYSNYLMSKQSRFMLDVASGRDLAKSSAKWLDWITVVPKALMLGLSPFHTISLAKSFTYSTGDLATAIEAVYDTNKAMLDYYQKAITFRFKGAEEVAEEFIKGKRAEVVDILKDLYPKLKEVGVDLKELPVTLGRTLDVAWMNAEANKMKEISRFLFGDRSPTAIIFEGMFPYLKAKDMQYVVDKALIDIKANPLKRQQIINDMIKNMLDVNWKYGGLPEFLMRSANARRAWRSILLAPDWQLSLIKQWGVPITAVNETRARYLSSMLAYNYLMYSLEMSKVRGYHDPVDDYDKFLKSMLLNKKNPFELLGWNNFLYKIDFFSYEKEPLDWILAFKDIVTHGNFHEAIRIFFNRSSMPIRFVQGLASTVAPEHWGWKGLAVQFPFLITLPIPIQNLINQKEMYDINVKGSLPITLLQSLSIRAQVVPATNMVAEMIRHDIFYPQAFETYINLPEVRKDLVRQFNESYGIYGLPKVAKPLSPMQMRSALTTSVSEKLIFKDYRIQLNDAISLAKEGKYKESRAKSDEIVNDLSAKIERFRNNIPENYKGRVSFYLPTKIDIGKTIRKLILTSLTSEQKNKYPDAVWKEINGDSVSGSLPPSLFASPYNDSDYLTQQLPMNE